MANILTREQTERFNKLRKAFKPWEEKGWAVECPDNDVLFFFVLGDDDNHYVETSFSGEIRSLKGISYPDARNMIQAYLPAFRLANNI